MDLGTARWQRGHGWQRPLPGIDDRPTLVLAFGPSDLLDDPEPVQELLAAYPSAAVVGCSTAGEILADTVSDGTLTVAVAQFDSTRLHRVEECIENPADSYYAGLRLAEKLVAAEPELDAVFVLSEGLAVNGSSVAAGLVQGTAGKVVISGGLAGDGDRFERTWVLSQGGLSSRHVVAIGLAGPRLVVRHGSGGGWDPFGPVRRITRSEGNVLYELDGQPALELYRRYLGDRADGLPATALLFPLAIRVPGAPDRELVRTVLSVDASTQSMTFAGDVPQGSSAQLMHSSLDRIVDGAEAAAASTALQDDTSQPNGTARQDDADPVLAIAVSCVGRRLVLGRRTEDEIEAVLSALPARTELVGFYSYGELSPVAAGSCDLHNQTMTITTIAERA
jgi:hypothetical protein